MTEIEKHIEEQVDSKENQNSETNKTKETDTLDSFQDMTVPELFKTLAFLIDQDNIEEIRPKVEDIKTEFYKQNKQEYNQLKQAFIEEGGKAEDFVFTNSDENTFKDLYSKYKSKRDTFYQRIGKQKQDNLTLRQDLIQELEKLINTKETLQHTFDVFRTIQERWKTAGQVPSSERKKIWESYHIQLARFYDYININKELRDLDLRKNLEAKTLLCEKAEALSQEKKIVKAFAKLQELHELWREIGPVQNDVKEDLWQRFKSATTVINKAHQDYFKSLKDKEKDNLEAKIELCEKVEDINSRSIKNIKTWKKTSEEVIALQKKWKTIGFAPQKHNAEIYNRFSQACDDFFTKKRDFFKTIHEQELANKDKKIALCEKAESMLERTDWKDASRDYIQLQKQWKEIGPVPLRNSNSIWRRFSKACDRFFKQKNEHFAQKYNKTQENVDEKKKVLATIKSLAVSEKNEDDLQKLQKLQREWNAIGNVPDEHKDALYIEYNTVIHEKYKELHISEEDKQADLYKIKIETLQQKDSAKIESEQYKLKNKRKHIEDELLLLENNKGFFTVTDKSSDIMTTMDAKIEKCKQDIEKINEQLRLIRSVKQKQ
ncbi:MAG: DUF349 domain-containing protein [Bacteroidales bacterium]|jgi:hypothetical protein|nr:DUF349 domain-containing protein [Bacteroidales bacterium]